MKRSSQVGLLLMGTVAVGGGAYALMPSEHCQPNGMTQYGTQSEQCNPRSSSSSSGGYRGSSSSYGYSSNSSYLSSQPGSTSSGGSSSGEHGSSGIARGGFGSFASHFTGGG